MFNYKRSGIWGFGLLVFLLLFVTNINDFKSIVPGNDPFTSSTLRLNFYRSDALLKGNNLLRKITSSVAGKVVTFRKKYKHLIEGNDDHSPYVKELQYTRYLDSTVNLKYETPHFISEQQSSLYRLSVF